MYHQLTSQQRSQIFALLQRKTSRKDIASIVGCSQSTLSREIRRNSTDKGNYLWDKAHAKAMERRKRATSNRSKDPAIIWEALNLLKDEDWSPEQISADMKKRGKDISHELIYRHIRADESGELASHCRHQMKYNRHGRPDRTTKVRNIPGRVSIHDRPSEADGTRFGDWEIGHDRRQGRQGSHSDPHREQHQHADHGEAASWQTSRTIGEGCHQAAVPVQTLGTLDHHRQRLGVLRPQVDFKGPGTEGNKESQSGILR